MKIKSRVFCDYCKRPFTISSININTKIIKGEKYLVSHFVCPFCGKKYFISVEDKWILSDKKNLQMQMSRLREMKANVETDKILIENQIRLIEEQFDSLKKRSIILRDALISQLD